MLSSTTVHRYLRALVLLLSLLLPAAPTYAAPGAVLTVGAGCTYATLQAAVNAAAASGDQIRMRAATFNGQTVISNKSVTISGGWDAGCATQTVGARTTLNGNQNGSVLEISGSGVVLLTDMQITGGTNDVDYGGGIQITNATVTLANTLVYDNGSDYGGGVYLNGGNLLLSNFAQIYYNSANQGGGGIYATGAGTITLQPNTFIGSAIDGFGNSAPNGGGIFVANAGLRTHLVTINGNATLQHNRATGATGLGGGIYMQGGTLNVAGSDAQIVNNSAYSGGGIQANNGASVTLAGHVSDNSATFRGGGINASGSTTDMRLNSATLARNAAGDAGGGIASNDVDIDFTGSTTIGGLDPADGNSAGTHGGGVYCITADCWFFDAALLSGNTANMGGGGYFVGGRPSFYQQSRVRANHSTSNGAGLYFTGDAAAIITNDVQIGGPTAADGNTTTNGGGGGIYADPASVDIGGNVLIANNRVAGFGGNGGAISARDSTVYLAGNAQLRDNQAENVGGGIILTASTLQFHGSAAIAANRARIGGGGYAFLSIIAMYETALLGGDMPADGNQSIEHGGGFYIGNSTFYMSGQPRVRFNSAGNDGGGFRLQDSALLSSDGGVIADNSAGTDGGGVRAFVADSIDLSNTVLTRNSAVNGGGIYSSGPIALRGRPQTQCSVDQLAANRYCAELRANVASGQGAAIYAHVSANVTLDRVAVLHHAGGSAAVYLNGVGSQFDDSLFADNDVPAVRSTGGSHDWSHLTFAGHSGQPFVLSGTGAIQVSNSIAWANAQNGSLGVYTVTGGCNRSAGGVLPGSDHTNPQFHTSPRGRYRLSLHSPAIDACPTGSAFDLDLRGRPVTLDGLQLYDQGAFEMPAIPTAVTLAAQATTGGAAALWAGVLAGVLALAVMSARRARRRRLP